MNLILGTIYSIRVTIGKGVTVVCVGMDKWFCISQYDITIINGTVNNDNLK
jgi:hypothetical protein